MSTTTTSTAASGRRSSTHGKRHHQHHGENDGSSDIEAVEYRAAYVSVVKGSSTDKPLTSKSDLLLALQNTGRNPTQKAISQYWTNTTEQLGFDVFCEICRKEPVTTEDDLMKAFKKIDINGDGFISHSELKKVMTTKGEKMTDEEVTKLIDEVDENKDGKLDYKEFSNMVLKTSSQCREKAQRRYEKKTSKSDEFVKTSEATFSSDRAGSLVTDTVEVRHKQQDTKHSDALKSRSRADSSRNAVNDGRRHEEESASYKHAEDRHSKHRERNDSFGSSKGKTSSTNDGTESKRGVPRSPRMSPLISPRGSKGSRSKDSTQKDKFGSQASLRSYDSRNDVPLSNGSPKGIPLPRPRVSSVEKRGADQSTLSEESPKPAPRQSSRQDTVKPALSDLHLKLPTPKKLEAWQELKRRGMFYVEDDGEITSTQYSLVISQSTSVWITIAPSPSQSTAEPSTPVDMSILVVRAKADKNGKTLITLTEKRDENGKRGVRCDLEAGTYYLLAFTSGCCLPITKPSKEAQKMLVRKKSDNQYSLTKEFKYVLTDIFNMVDTDMNGLLSRDEFNQYSIRTGEDEIGDDEWQIVKENAELKKGELTCKGFIKLIELEAEDAGGDADDLWLALEALGYDSSLVQNQAYPFTLEVYAETGEPTLNPLPSLLGSKSGNLQNALQEVFTSKGELLATDKRCRAAKSSGNDRDVQIYVYETDTQTSIAIENKLPSRATIKLDCTASRNVKANKSLNEVFAVPGSSFMVAHHLVASDERKEWFVSCVEKELLMS